MSSTNAEAFIATTFVTMLLLAWRVAYLHRFLVPPPDAVGTGVVGDVVASLWSALWRFLLGLLFVGVPVAGSVGLTDSTIGGNVVMQICAFGVVCILRPKGTLTVLAQIQQYWKEGSRESPEVTYRRVTAERRVKRIDVAADSIRREVAELSDGQIDLSVGDGDYKTDISVPPAVVEALTDEPARYDTPLGHHLAELTAKRETQKADAIKKKLAAYRELYSERRKLLSELVAFDELPKQLAHEREDRQRKRELAKLEHERDAAALEVERKRHEVDTLELSERAEKRGRKRVGYKEEWETVRDKSQIAHEADLMDIRLSRERFAEEEHSSLEWFQETYGEEKGRLLFERWQERRSAGGQ